MAKGNRRQSFSVAQRREQKNPQQQKNVNQLFQQKDDLTAKRQYKDTIFRMLFSDKKICFRCTMQLITVLIKIQTPGDRYLGKCCLYGDEKCLAFIINTNIFLYEHQSTYNPNMPLRDLFYISSEYQKLVDKRSLYSSTLQKIPAPRFVVFIMEQMNGKTTVLIACRKHTRSGRRAGILS